MTDYHAAAAAAARKYGIPVPIFLKQIAQESGFNPRARSGAGALGIAQIVPRWHPGVDPWNPIEALDYAAKLDASLMKQYGSLERALSAYNSGRPDAYLRPGFAGGQTYNYVRSIMGGASPAVTGGATAGASTAPPPVAQGIPPEIQAILNRNNSLAGIPRINYGQPTQPSPSPVGSRVPVAPVAKAVANAGKWVRFAPNADRSGVKTNSSVAQFVAQVARTYGNPLTIGTGTRHSQYVAGTNRESQHWRGNAADIPASGSALTRMGQAALVAAGMSPAKARKQKGGIYNLNGRQIIFNASGHWDHLHVGV